ncbi:MAG: CocE/NonD family hydrolase [SAR202 cluster bacterium]|nr:CocE/NonD family hydrolase [SAR202 cluster bacterium]|tara:strand:+ start:39587 stop:41311 length:1725 start_codon:yes stop_codon:yes gene_type:complete
MNTNIDSFPLVEPGRLMLNIPVPMRDGINLSADIWLPPSSHGKGPWPALLLRTIYDNQEARYIGWAREFTNRGYAVIMQDCRGRGDSDGEWIPYVCELYDGYDTHQWIGKQDWCDGNLGTFGLSYPGFTQTLPATLRSKYLKAVAPIASQQDNYGHHRVNGVIHHNVAFAFLNMLGRSMQYESLKHFDQDTFFFELPIDTAMEKVSNTHPYYKGVMEHEQYDEWWSSYSLRDKYPEMAIPSLFITGWFDSLSNENFKLFNGWTKKAKTQDARSKTKLIIGPWSHQIAPWGRVPMGENGEYADRTFGKQALSDVIEMHMHWYDQRLKGINTGVDEEAPIKLFVMGKNIWRDEYEWPLERTKWTKFYLSSSGNAVNDGGGLYPEIKNNDQISDSFIYDPANPVPSLGSQYQTYDFCGPHDRSHIQRRPDVLTFTTDVLTEDMEITGPISATIWASSDAKDTDFTATLTDLEPDGKAIALCEGIVRARFRNGTENPEMMVPGEIYQFEIDMWNTSNNFNKGHRIRIEISSSNFPRYNRNLNSGNPIASDSNINIANQTVYHGSKYPSYVNLPVIPKR